MHYYQFNIADYRKDTAHLTPLEHYIYRELIDWCYLDECEIPKKTDWVIRRLRLVSENKPSVLNVLEEFFEETETGYIHKRIMREIEKYQAKAKAARVNGSKGGRPKKPKKTQPVNLANPEKTGSKPNHKPITNNQYKENKQKKVAPTFEEVKEYADKRGKPDLAQQFFDYFEAGDWVDSKGNRVKSWKQKFLTWEKYHNNGESKINQRPAAERPESNHARVVRICGEAAK